MDASSVGQSTHGSQLLPKASSFRFAKRPAAFAGFVSSGANTGLNLFGKATDRHQQQQRPTPNFSNFFSKHTAAINISSTHHARAAETACSLENDDYDDDNDDLNHDNNNNNADLHQLTDTPSTTSAFTQATTTKVSTSADNNHHKPSEGVKQSTYTRKLNTQQLSMPHTLSAPDKNNSMPSPQNSPFLKRIDIPSTVTKSDKSLASSTTNQSTKVDTVNSFPPPSSLIALSSPITPIKTPFIRPYAPHRISPPQLLPPPLPRDTIDSSQQQSQQKKWSSMKQTLSDDSICAPSSFIDGHTNSVTSFTGNWIHTNADSPIPTSYKLNNETSTKNQSHGSGDILSQLSDLLNDKQELEREREQQTAFIQKLETSADNQANLIDLLMDTQTRTETLSSYIASLTTSNATRLDKVQSQVRLLLMVAQQVKSGAQALASQRTLLSSWETDIQSSIQQANQCNVTLKAELATVNSRLNVLSTDMQDKCHQLQVTQEAKEQYERQLTQSEEQYQSVCTERERLTTELNERVITVETMENTIVSLREQSVLLNAHSSTVNRELSELRESYNSQQQAHKLHIADCTMEKTTAANELENIRSENERLEHEIQSIQQKLTNTEDFLTKISMAMTSLCACLREEGNKSAHAAVSVCLPESSAEERRTVLMVLERLEQRLLDTASIVDDRRQRHEKEILRVQHEADIHRKQLQNMQETLAIERNLVIGAQEKHNAELLAIKLQNQHLETALQASEEHKAELVNQHAIQHNKDIMEIQRLEQAFTALTNEWRDMLKRMEEKAVIGTRDAQLAVEQEGELMRQGLDRVTTKIENVLVGAQQSTNECFSRFLESYGAQAHEACEQTRCLLQQELEQCNSTINSLREQLRVSDQSRIENNENDVQKLRDLEKETEDLKAQLLRHEEDASKMMAECRRQITECFQRDQVTLENQVKRLEHQLQLTQQKNEQQQQQGTENVISMLPLTDRQPPRLADAAQRMTTSIKEHMHAMKQNASKAVTDNAQIAPVVKPTQDRLKDRTGKPGRRKLAANPTRPASSAAGMFTNVAAPNKTRFESPLAVLNLTSYGDDNEDSGVSDFSSPVPTAKVSMPAKTRQSGVRRESKRVASNRPPKERQARPTGVSISVGPGSGRDEMKTKHKRSYEDTQRKGEDQDSLEKDPFAFDEYTESPLAKKVKKTDMRILNKQQTLQLTHGSDREIHSTTTV